MRMARHHVVAPGWVGLEAMRMTDAHAHIPFFLAYAPDNMNS